MKDKVEKYHQFMANYIKKVNELTNNRYLINSVDIIKFETMIAEWTLDKVKEETLNFTITQLVI